MSFILDALKKAEAERNLAHLPGLHAGQTVAAALPSMHRGWRSRQVWPAVAMVGGAALMVGLLGWHFGLPRQQSAPTEPLAATSMQPGSASAVSQMATVPATVRLETPAPVPTPPPAPAPATELPVPKAAQTPRKVPALQGGPMPLPSKKVLPASISAPTTASTPTPIVALADLPPAIQREIPPLAISGSMYSSNAADRMVLLDKRMLHEGDEIAPGLTLDRVLPKGAILRYKGHVFQISH